MKKGGALMYPYKNKLSDVYIDSVLAYYLRNATHIERVSNGTYGLTIKIAIDQTKIDTLDQNKLYKHMIPDDKYDTNVSELLIKLIYISPNDYHYTIGDYRCVSESEFIDEVNIQTDVFFKTFEYMKPLCPSIVYAGIFSDYRNKLSIEQSFERIVALNNDSNSLGDNSALSFMNELMMFPTVGLGIIVMELLNNAHTVSKIFKFRPNSLQFYKTVSIYLLLKLALETGYNHGDFHKNNIMLMTDKTYFGPSVPFRPVIIDFGRTHKIPLDTLNLIKDSVKNKNYLKAVSYLCVPEASNCYISDVESNNLYGWICQNYNVNVEEDITRYVDLMNHYCKNKYKDNVPPLSQFKKYEETEPIKINSTVNHFFNLREKAIDESIKKMNELHAQEPDKYPLLPLSNQIKNRLYNGMIGGRRRVYKKRSKDIYKIRNKKRKSMKSRNIRTRRRTRTRISGNRKTINRRTF